ncbi:MAG TPA: glycosyltransferase family 4 protein [Geminicoccaceae bacterium]|nr:glycosyltransferase family 4 protein [Geminicoccaceae bacterium]
MSAGAAASVWCLGGEDSHLRIAFCRRLADLGFDVTAVGTGDAAPFVRSGVRYLRYRLDRFLDPLGDARSLDELAGLIGRHRPDIVHGFDTKPSLLAPLATARAGVGRAVRTINGMGYVFSSGSPLALALRPVYRVLQRRVAPRTAMTVFQNAPDLAYFERHRLVPPARSRLVPGSGIDVDGFLARLPGPARTERLRRELGLGGRRVVTTVSRLTRQKGIPTLLAAAGRLAPRHPDAVFLLVGPRDGEGPFAVPRAALDRHRPYVRALGVRDDVPALLALTDVFVLPTEYREGVPRALLEAGAAGCPVVATRMPGCTDVVRHGWNGLLVEPGDAAGLADAIGCLLLARPERRRVMGARGRALVRERFPLDGVARAYADIYEEVLRT